MIYKKKKKSLGNKCTKGTLLRIPNKEIKKKNRCYSKKKNRCLSFCFSSCPRQNQVRNLRNATINLEPVKAMRRTFMT